MDPGEVATVDEAGKSCIPAEDLVAMLEGGLAGERYQYVIAHLDHCPTCAKAIEKLGSFERGDRKVGRYQLERVLGAGGMGVVYRAWDPQLRRTVAVKLLRPERSNDVSRARMLREARALARVAHPNVVAVYDVGEHDGEVFITTEFVDGETLESWVTGKSHREIIAAYVQVARGLVAAHAEGVIHRDVKPANAFVGRDGRVRIGDFGLAREGEREDLQLRVPIDSHHKLSLAGGVAGTPAYMSPEQWHGEADARSDQYGLCVSLGEALTGERANEDTVPAVEPPALAAVLGRGLRGNPDERYPTMRELADALVAAVSPPSRRTWVIAIVGVAMVATTVAVAAAIIARSKHAASCEVPVLDEPLTPALHEKLGPIANEIDRWAARWRSAAADLCTDEPPIRNYRAQCLETKASALRELVAGWEREPPTPNAYTYFQIGEQRAAECSSARVKSRIEPTIPQQAGVVALTWKWTAATSLEQQRALLELVKQLDYPHFTVQLVRNYALKLPRDEQLATLRSLLPLVERDPREYVEAALTLMQQLGTTGEAEALRIAETIKPHLATLDDPGVEVMLDVRLGALALELGRTDEALSAYERARRGMRFAYGEGSLAESGVVSALGQIYLQRDPRSPKGLELADTALAMLRKNGISVGVDGPASSMWDDPPDSVRKMQSVLAAAKASKEPMRIALAEKSLGVAYAQVDQHAEAIAHFKTFIELYEKQKLVDAELVSALTQIADQLGELDRKAEGLPFVERAVALAAQLRIDTELATALTIQGSLLVELHREAEAREPLQRALAIRDKLNAPSNLRGNTRYWQARALWISDKTRARSLATAAREDISSAIERLDRKDALYAVTRKSLEAKLAAIDALLATK